ncbi:uncharacterized protein LOC130624206 [Hydractinia symbiolongicarpus]|uniref:uncharacterized protein LOC130624206 n=1 Tax=Hydractinia symbiolongicarpus TaxID=13093 RepID=UPI00254C9F33|nr:uncharacterized protein LOC130624206 [Hydractinia symbiolongicarpus]
MAAFNNETCSSDHMFKTLKSIDWNNNATEECSITTDFKASRENEQEKSATGNLTAKRNASTQKNDPLVNIVYERMRHVGNELLHQELIKKANFKRVYQISDENKMLQEYNKELERKLRKVKERNLQLVLNKKIHHFKSQVVSTSTRETISFETHTDPVLSPPNNSDFTTHPEYIELCYPPRLHPTFMANLNEAPPLPSPIFAECMIGLLPGIPVVAKQSISNRRTSKHSMYDSHEIFLMKQKLNHEIMLTPPPSPGANLYLGKGYESLTKQLQQINDHQSSHIQASQRRAIHSQTSHRPPNHSQATDSKANYSEACHSQASYGQASYSQVDYCKARQSHANRNQANHSQANHGQANKGFNFANTPHLFFPSHFPGNNLRFDMNYGHTLNPALNPFQDRRDQGNAFSEIIRDFKRQESHCNSFTEENIWRRFKPY